MGQAREADEWTLISPTNTKQIVRATPDLLSNNKKQFTMWEKEFGGSKIKVEIEENTNAL